MNNSTEELEVTLTHDALKFSSVFAVNTIDYFKNAVVAFREFCHENKVVTSIFLLEQKNILPVNVLLNREIVAALINNVFQLALSSSKSKGVSIYISWRPLNAANQASNNYKQNGLVDPVYILDYRFRQGNNQEEAAVDKNQRR